MSVGSRKDVLIGTILDESFFASTDSALTIEKGTEIRATLPLMLEEALVEVVESAEESIKSTV